MPAPANVVRLLFSRRHHPGSHLIRIATWSGWSHVDLIDGDQLIGAVAPAGVVVTPLADRLALASTAAVMDIPCPDPRTVLEAARTQIGKPYDWIGVLGIAAHRDWQEPDRWFCSELAAWAFQVTGHPLFRASALFRVTPQHLWMLPHPARFIREPSQLQPA